MSDEPELPPVREALCYLPAFLGRDYAEAAVEGGFLRYDLREALMDVALRMEALRRLSEQAYLDKNHDYRSRPYIIEKACLVETQGIFVLGYWTPEGLPLRSSYQGVSSAGLEYHKKFPPPEEHLEVKRRQWEEDKKNLAPDADFFGSLGCVCIGDYRPTFPGTIKTLPLNGEADDLAHLSVAFNSAKISWPVIPNGLTE